MLARHRPNAPPGCRCKPCHGRGDTRAWRQHAAVPLLVLGSVRAQRADLGACHPSHGDHAMPARAVTEAQLQRPQVSACEQHSLDRMEHSSGRRGVLLLLGAGIGLQLGRGARLLDGGGVAQALAAEGITTVFVAGATGQTGRRVVRELRGAGLAVRAGVRSTAKALELGLGADPGVALVETDVTQGTDRLMAAIGGAQAVVCVVGAAGFGPNGAKAVDEQGTISLIDAALAAGASKFVLVSSLLTNAAAAGQGTNPNYLFLNLLGGVLDRKLAAEKYLRASGLNYTIIRPGGLSNEPEAAVGNLVVSREDSLFALDSDPGSRISRDTLAALVAQAVLRPEASRDRVLEVVASPAAPSLPKEQWFEQ